MDCTKFLKEKKKPILISLVLGICVTATVLVVLKLTSDASYTVWSLDSEPILDASLGATDNSKKKVLVCVDSSPWKKDLRKTIRETWRREDIKVIFFLGSRRTPKEQKEVEDESRTYQDMVQFKFMEVPENKTLKAVATIMWVKRNNWPSREFIGMATENTFVNTPLLVSILDKLNETAIYGNITKDSPPEHLHKTFFIIANAAVEPLNDCLLAAVRGEEIAEVYITGTVADLAKIPRREMPSGARIVTTKYPQETLIIKETLAANMDSATESATESAIRVAWGMVENKK